jgi:hypothetical protein
MALQPFVGSWTLLQAVGLLGVLGRVISLQAATYIQDDTNTNIHALSGIRTHWPQRSREQRLFMP